MAVLVGSLAACTGQAGGPTPTTMATSTPEPTSSPVAVPSSDPPATTAPVAGRHADPDLETLLPETLGGVALTRESQRGTELSSRSEALEAFLSDLGRTLDDFSLASAYAASGDLEAEVGAWRIRGADPARLMDGFAGAVQASSTTPLTITPSELAGRVVTRIGAEGELTRGPLYAYVVGDVIVFVQTPHEDLAEEAIGKLPAPSG
jgi:hypothetical protein